MNSLIGWRLRKKKVGEGQGVLWRHQRRSIVNGTFKRKESGQMKPIIKAVYCDGMVNIDSLHIAYANMKGMYKENNCRFGLQLEGSLEYDRLVIEDLCNSISEMLYKLAELTKKGD